MSNNFVVEKSTVDRFDFVVYGTQAESILSSLGKIQAELKDAKEAVVLFDNLLYSSNSIDRFVKATISNGSFDMDSFEVVALKKADPVRQMAKDFFCRNANLIRSSAILNSVQRMLLLKGIAI